MLSGQRHHPLSIEGMSTSQWILMDFGDVVAHIFRSDIREHYGLEKLWSDAKRVRLPETERPATATLAPPRKRRSRNARQG
jgi:ribosome-associated protein